MFNLQTAAGKYDPVSARAAKPGAETCGAEDRAQVHIRKARYPGKKPAAFGRRGGDVRHDVAQPAVGHDSVLRFREQRAAAAGRYREGVPAGRETPAGALEKRLTDGLLRSAGQRGARVHAAR